MLDAFDRTRVGVQRPYAAPRCDRDAAVRRCAYESRRFTTERILGKGVPRAERVEVSDATAAHNPEPLSSVERSGVRLAAPGGQRRRQRIGAIAIDLEQHAVGGEHDQSAADRGDRPHRGVDVGARPAAELVAVVAIQAVLPTDPQEARGVLRQGGDRRAGKTLASRITPDHAVLRGEPVRRRGANRSGHAKPCELSEDGEEGRAGHGDGPAAAR